MALTNRFAPATLARAKGGVINVAFTAAFQPVPYMAGFGATKAFVLSFSEALAEEFCGRGVRVRALCPGATRTNFFNVAGEGAQVGRFRTPGRACRLRYAPTIAMRLTVSTEPQTASLPSNRASQRAQ